MSMSVNLHAKGAYKFKTQGYATQSAYAGTYPVIKIEVSSDKSNTNQEITLFMDVEQLLQLRKQISKAIRETHNLKQHTTV